MASGILHKILYYMGFEDDIKEDKPAVNQTTTYNPKGRVINIHQNSTVKVVVMECKDFKEACDIGDQLKERKPVIINLIKMEHEEAKRLIDFISGVVYAIDGEIKKIGAGTFLVAPNNVDVSGEISQEILDSSTKEIYLVKNK
jgi:cell division inhibitor SepF